VFQLTSVPVLPHIVAIFFSSTVVRINCKWHFLSCATIAFSERQETKILNDSISNYVGTSVLTYNMAGDAMARITAPDYASVH
jgi:hypothetical protein